MAGVDIENVGGPRVTNNWKKEAREKQPPKQGDVASGCLGDCLPFSVTAIATISVTSFDLISDWLAYQVMKQQQSISSSSDNADDFLQMFLKILPNLLLGFCIASTLIFIVIIIRLSYMLCAQRRIFMAKRDGVPYKANVIEKYGGEVLTFLQCLIQNIPQSVLYLLLQTSISCDMLHYLQHPVLFVSYIATILSILYKALQVIWNSGCFRHRENYLKGWQVSVLRGLTMICILCALVATSLNIVLGSLSNQRIYPNMLHNVIFDKLGIDKWLEEDYVVLQQTLQRDDDNQTLIPICLIKDIIQREGKTLSVITDSVEGIRFSNMQHSGTNCSIVYQFQYHAAIHTVYYHLGHKCFSENGNCFATVMDDITSNSMHLKLSSTSAPQLTTNFVPEEITKNSEIFHPPGSIDLSDMDHPQWIKCPLKFVWNNTLLSFNPCSFLPIDQ